MTKEIRLTKGCVALVDDDDFEWLCKYKWHVSGGGYACSVTGIDTRTTGQYHRMHRLVIGATVSDKRFVDHINGNRLDNRKSNLRFCTNAENIRNSIGKRKDGLKGASWSKRDKMWRSRICVNGVSKYLGEYKTEEEAHEVYCLAADMLHGEFAKHG